MSVDENELHPIEGWRILLYHQKKIGEDYKEMIDLNEAKNCIIRFFDIGIVVDEKRGRRKREDLDVRAYKRLYLEDRRFNL